jgi:AcrR family transcriptional regulator
VYVTNVVRQAILSRMSSDAAPRSRRDRPAKPALSREAIVDASLAIVREEGIDALSMRRLAQALDTGPASLYVYVANRDELWDLVFDAAGAAIETEPTDPARWREQLHRLASRMVDLMVVEYPGLARLAMARIPVGENSMRVAESMMSLLKAGGASDQAAAYAGDLISMYITAIAFEQSLHATLYKDPEHEAREIQRIAERFASLDPERYPTIAALREDMTRGDERERFALGLDVLINGLLQTPTEGRLTRLPWTEAPSS